MFVPRFSPSRALAVVGVFVCGALAAPPASAVNVFSDNFESYAPDTNIYGGGSVWRSVDTDNGAIKARTDTTMIFGPDNQYMEYLNDSTSDHPEMSAKFLPIVGHAARLSFDFYEPSGGPADTVRIALGNDLNSNNTTSSDERTIEVQFSGGWVIQSHGTPGAGVDFAVSGAYDPNTVNHIDVIANYGSETYTYSLGNVVNGTVAPKKIDILLNGELLNTEFDLDFRNENEHDRVDTIHMFSSSSAISRGFIDNLVVSAAVPFVTVDRSTGNITLTNESGSTIDNIIGYTITSAAGTLNSSDTVWNSIAATNPSWEVLTGEGGVDLSEAALNSPFTPISVANNGTIDFGEVWYQHPVEDIQFELLLDDGSEDGLVVPVIVAYSGGSEGFSQFALGDFNFDGVVNGQDVEHFGNYYYVPLNETAPGATYAFGDLNGDLVTDYDDLVQFRGIYDSVNGAGAFALALSGATAVPEPSSLLLAGTLLGGVLLGRRRWGRGAAMAGALVVLLAMVPATQADIVFQENFDGIPANTAINNTTVSAFSTAVSIGTSDDATVLVDASNLFRLGAENQYLRYEDGGTSAPRLTGPADLTSAALFELAFDFLDPTLDVGQNLRLGLTNAGGDNASKPLDIEFNEGVFNYRGTAGQIFVNYDIGQSYSVKAVGNFGATPMLYNNGEDWLAPLTFDVWMKSTEAEDFVRVSNNVPMSNNGIKSTHVTIGSTGPTQGDLLLDNIVVHNTIDSFSVEGEALLTLRVNTETGNVSIRNGYDHGFSLNLDTYQITGEAGSFNLANWNSLDDQEGADPAGQGWVAAGSSTSSMLNEFTADGTFDSLASQQSLNLGNVFNTSADTQSLSFQYAFDNGPLLNGQIEFVTPGGLQGDFNGDGVVDAADYTVWRNNLGGDESALGGNGNNNGVVDSGDYALWKAHFGQSAPAALALASTQVPEPASVVWMLGAALAGIATLKRRRG